MPLLALARLHHVTHPQTGNHPLGYATDVFTLPVRPADGESERLRSFRPDAVRLLSAGTRYPHTASRCALRYLPSQHDSDLPDELVTLIDLPCTRRYLAPTSREPAPPPGEPSDQTVIEALDPQAMVAVAGAPSLQPVANEAATRLRAGLDTLREAD